MTPLAPLPPRLDQLARLLALGWLDERIADEMGLTLSSVYSARRRLRRTWDVVGRDPNGPLAWADLVLRGAIRSYVNAPPAPGPRLPAVPRRAGGAGSGRHRGRLGTAGADAAVSRLLATVAGGEMASVSPALRAAELRRAKGCGSMTIRLR